MGIKKLTILLYCLLSALNMSADDGLSINGFETVPGATNTVSVIMNNSYGVLGFQFDIALPEGVTLINAEIVSTRTSSNYNIKQNTLKDGSIRLICMPESVDAVFSGTTGEVMQLTFDIASDASYGDVVITLKNQCLTIVNGDLFDDYSTDATTATISILPYILGDVDNNALVNIADVVAIVSYLNGSVPTNFNYKAADFDDNDKIDKEDVIGIVNHIIKK